MESLPLFTAMGASTEVMYLAAIDERIAQGLDVCQGHSRLLSWDIGKFDERLNADDAVARQ